MPAILYHAGCHDGMASAAIVSKALNNNAFTFPYSYGWKFDFSRLREGEEVIIVDVSMPLDQMKYMDEHYNLTWIDHHDRDWDGTKEAEGFNPKGIRVIDPEKAGCILCWEYYFKDKPVPPALQLISNFDNWHIDRPNVIEFDYALRAHDLRPIRQNQHFWDKIIDNDAKFLNELLQTGEAIASYQEELCGIAQWDLLCTAKLGEYTATVANTRGFSSLFFNGSEADTDLLILYAWIAKTNTYRFSVYSNKPEINVAEILKPYGGGGRGGVGGFSRSTLPFEPIPGHTHVTPKEPIYSRPQELIKEFPVVAKHAHKNMRVSVQSTYGNVMFEGYKAIAANVLFTDMSAFYTVWDPAEHQLAIGWVWTNTGKHRLVIHAFDKTIDLGPIKEKYNANEVEGNLWIYTVDLPFPPS